MNHLTHGKFEPGHRFDGYLYYGIQGLTNKTCRLTINNQYAREANITRIPVIDEADEADPGGTNHRFLELISPGPGQTRLYCYEATR